MRGLITWPWFRRRRQAAEVRAIEAERVAAKAQERWAEVNDLSDRFAQAAINAMSQRKRRRTS